MDHNTVHHTNQQLPTHTHLKTKLPVTTQTQQL
jgi:hypothetical protein